MRFLFAALTLFLVAGNTVSAQETWTRYCKTNRITDIAVHGDYVWCATTGGLVRWDRRTGTYSEIPPKDNSAYNTLTTIEAAPDGSIWGIVRGDAYQYGSALREHQPTYLVHYDGFLWTEYESSWYDFGLNTDQQAYSGEKSVVSLAVDSDGTVWSGISYDINYMYDLFSVGCGLSRYKNGLWFNTPVGSWSYNGHYSEIQTGAAYLISSVAAGPDKTVWISTSGAGIFQYDGQTVHSVQGAVTGKLSTGPDGTVWLIGDKTVQRLEGEKWVSVSIPSGLLANGISSFVSDGGKSLWIGTNNGLLHYDGAEWNRYTEADGLAGTSITSLAMDDSGVCWVGTSNGLASCDGVSFHSYRMEDRLPDDTVHTLAFEPDGTVWAGTSSGISRFNGETWRSFTTADGLPDSSINAIAVSADGGVWAATSKGAARFDGSVWKIYTTADGLASNTIYSIAAGKDGEVWFGTSEGVSSYNGTSWQTYSTEKGLPAADYYFISANAEGTVWTSDARKIFRLSGNHWSEILSGNDYNFGEYVSIAGLTADTSGAVIFAVQGQNGVHHPSYGIILGKIDADSTSFNFRTGGIFSCFAAARDNTIWCAEKRKYGGMESSLVSSPQLLQFKSGNTGVFTVSNGLSSSVVNAIAIAPDGAVWCGTDRGLSRYGVPRITGVGSETALPREYAVVSNHPNPFNPSTTISFTLPSTARADLAVYSISGQKVRTLLSERMTAGTHSTVWDGKDDSGKAVSSGVYLAHLRVGKQSASRRMTLVK